MKMRNTILPLMLIVLMTSILPNKSNGQEVQTRYLNLDDVISIAKQQSPSALAARHTYRGSYWQHRSYKAAYLPALTLGATLPDLLRNISPITLPDGTDVFVRRSLATSSATLSLSQRVGLTGGEIFMSSGLRRIDLIRSDGNSTSYLSTPINIGFRQPIFAFNPFKWEQRIEPLRFNEAQKRYVESMEMIAVRASTLFFDLLLAQINININEINLSNNDTLYQISKGRYSLGRIAENELLQMELNVLNSEAMLEQSKINYEDALFRFRSFLALENVENISLLVPDQRHNMNIKVEDALMFARSNRSALLTFERQKMEAEREISRARSESRFNADMFAVYGLTQTASNLPDAYVNPFDEQQLRIGVQVPILDWGVGKGRVKMAESNLELVNTNVQQSMNDFDQEVLLRVMEFNMLDRQLNIASTADLIAEKRYEISRQRYIIGRIDITELNIALAEKDRAKQGYLSALRTYWSGFYEMRRLTLFDFINNKPITIDLDDVI